MYAIEVVSAGGASVFSLPPAGKPLVVGSGMDADVRVADPGVEARHLLIEVTPAGVRVKDNGTSGGTRMNGLFVSQALVKVGDEILVGETRIRLVEDIEAAPAPTSPGTPSPASSKPASPRAPRARTPSRRQPGSRAPSKKAPTSKTPGQKPAQGKPPAKRPGVQIRSVRNPQAKPAAGAPVVAVKPGPRKAPARRRGPGPLVVGIAVLLVAVFGILFFLSSGESGRERAAREAYDRAQILWSEGDRDAAESVFDEILTSWPDSPMAERATTALEALEEERRQEARAAAAVADLRSRWTQLTLEELTEEHREIVSTYPNTAAAGDAGFLDEMGRAYEAEGRRRFDDTRRRAADLTRKGRYYDAVLAWHEYLYIPSNIPPDIASATDEFQRIQTRADRAFESVAEEAGKLLAAEEFDRAAGLLAARLEEFRGTRHAFEIRQKLALVDILRGGEEIEPEVVEARVSKREEFLRTAEDAESLVRMRRYADAVAMLRRAAGECPHEDLAARMKARAGDLEDYAALFTALRTQIREKSERFRGIDLGNGFKANAVNADEEHITVKVRNAESRLAWSRLGPERLLSLLVRLDVDPAGQLRLARFAFEAGDEDAGHRAVTAALKSDEKLTERAFAMLARARGIEVPEGGFVFFKGRWLTPEEKAEAELRAAIADAERDARSSDDRKRESGLARLREFGKPGEKALLGALEHQRRLAVDTLLSLPVVRDQATKQVLYKDLLERRKAALALIFDQVKYPYPHPEGPEYDAVQAEVDKLVDAVRTIWESPIAWILSKSPEAQALYSRAEEYSQELSALGHPPEVPFEKLVAKVNEAVNMPRFTPDSKSKKALEWNDKVAEYHREIEIDADEAERDCVDAVNEYRAMMGLTAVKWNDKILVAARGHSVEMREKGFFAHNVPLAGAEYDDHRTPTQRARKAGYGGGVSENIARGSTDGRATFKQWYGSSGHHRNMLGSRHIEIGVGRSQDFWTQNFGSASRAFDLPRKPKVAPEEGK